MKPSGRFIDPLPIPDMNSHIRVVYYVTAEHTGVVKIGTTNNMNRRFRSMAKSVTGAPLRLLAWEQGGFDLESERLIQFRETSKVFGDWMVLTGEVRSHIVRCRERMESKGFILPPPEWTGWEAA